MGILIYFNSSTLTQWFSQFPVTTADPKVRAPLTLAPVNLMPAKWANATVRPMAKAPVYLVSVLFSSQTPMMTINNMNPRKNSMAIPCSGNTSVANVVCPRPPYMDSGRTAFMHEEPATAPAHWTITYMMARTKLIFPIDSIAMVTDGFMCPPLMCPMACK